MLYEQGEGPKPREGFGAIVLRLEEQAPAGWIIWQLHDSDSEYQISFAWYYQLPDIICKICKYIFFTILQGFDKLQELVEKWEGPLETA